MGRASLDITSLWLPRGLSVHLWSVRSPVFENEKYVLSFNWEKYFIFALRVNVAKFSIANCYDKYLATYGSCLGWENFDLMTLFVWVYLRSLSTFLLWEKSAIHSIYLFPLKFYSALVSWQPSLKPALFIFISITNCTLRGPNFV